MAARLHWPGWAHPPAPIHRLLRFGLVGGACAVAQLALLAGLVRLGVAHSPANIAALVLSTQLNFLLSAVVIWPDRPTQLHPCSELLRRLAAFNLMCASTMVLNALVFALSVRYLPYLLAGVLSIVCAAPLNYLIAHLMIFRSTHQKGDSHGPRNQRLRRPAGL